MLQINQITTNALQQQNVVMPDGTILTLVFYFRPLQQGWFINQLIWSSTSFTLNGLRITNSPNMLNQWKNILNFGLGCFSSSTREPSLLTDFSSGYSNLYILTQSEVTQWNEFLTTGVFPNGS